LSIRQTEQQTNVENIAFVTMTDALSKLGLRTTHAIIIKPNLTPGNVDVYWKLVITTGLPASNYTPPLLTPANGGPTTMQSNHNYSVPMMAVNSASFCTVCGRPVAANFAFCAGCGAKNVAFANAGETTRGDIISMPCVPAGKFAKLNEEEENQPDAFKCSAPPRYDEVVPSQAPSASLQKVLTVSFQFPQKNVCSSAVFGPDTNIDGVKQHLLYHFFQPAQAVWGPVTAEQLTLVMNNAPVPNLATLGFLCQGNSACTAVVIVQPARVNYI
jgi:hypothetical protein